MPRVSRPAVVVVTGLAAAALLAACSSSGAGQQRSSSAGVTTPGSTAAPATPTDTVTVSPSAPSASTGDTGSNGGSGGGSGGSNSVARCTESQLRASIDPRPVDGTADAGDHGIIVDFTNTSTTSCTITGYPGAALVDSNGKQVKQATRTLRGRKLGLPSGQDSLPVVTLRPGAVASAGIEGVNQREAGAAQAGCDGSYHRILVTPPNTRTAVPFNQDWPICYSFDVHPTNIEKNPPS